MPTLRIVTWSVSAFRNPRSADAWLTSAIIRRTKADVVCIQGLRLGASVVGEIGAPPPADARAFVDRLALILHVSDAGAGWSVAMSGVNADVTDPSRGFYVFFWKSTPSGSREAHDEPVDSVTGLGGPVILRQFPDDDFPGRRPAMLAVVVESGQSAVLLNVIAYHASGMKSSKRINALATLPEVGGGIWTEGPTYQQAGPYPLPDVDTVVVGDFKTRMDYPRAGQIYINLLTNYQGCVSTPNACVFTEYTPSNQGLALNGAPDNIFVLRDHGGFESSLDPFQPAGVVDVIAEKQPTFGRPIGVCPATADHGWGITYQDASGQCHFDRTVSSHLPVWCDLSLVPSSDTAAHLAPTTTGHDGLLHAVMGTLVNGMFTDAQAASHRQQIVDFLREQQAQEGPAFFPAELSSDDVIVLEPEPGTDVVEEVMGVDVVGGNSIDVGDAVLRGMQLTFVREPNAVTLLQAIREKRQAEKGAVDPFIDPEYSGPFNQLYDRYVTGICSGRPFHLEEVLLVAEVLGVQVRLLTLRNNQYVWNVFTPSINVLPDPHHYLGVSIFGDGWHFYRLV